MIQPLLPYNTIYKDIPPNKEFVQTPIGSSETHVYDFTGTSVRSLSLSLGKILDAHEWCLYFWFSETPAGRLYMDRKWRITSHGKQTIGIKDLLIDQFNDTTINTHLADVKDILTYYDQMPMYLNIKNQTNIPQSYHIMMDGLVVNYTMFDFNRTTFDTDTLFDFSVSSM